MSLHRVGGVALQVARANRVSETANRIFVALRNETRACSVTNDEVAQLLDLAESLATRIVDGTGGHARERPIIARVCAALDAQHAATADLRSAITRVRDRLDDVLR
jgi:hypothetical protein